MNCRSMTFTTSHDSHSFWLIYSCLARFLMLFRWPQSYGSLQNAFPPALSHMVISARLLLQVSPRF
jgi:hypothetical protein